MTRSGMETRTVQPVSPTVIPLTMPGSPSRIVRYSKAVPLPDGSMGSASCSQDRRSAGRVQGTTGFFASRFPRGAVLDRPVDGL